MDPSPGALHDLQTRFLSAQLAGDRREALRLLIEEGVERGVEVRRLHSEVIERAQHEVGRLWQQNQISVADEHQATAIAQLAMSRLYPHLTRQAPVSCTAVMACATGETHDLGARMVADYLEAEGVATHYLGANVSYDALSAALREHRADVVALSVALNKHLPAAAREVAALRVDHPGVQVWLGGSAFAEVEAGDARFAGATVLRGTQDLAAALRARLPPRPIP